VSEGEARRRKGKAASKNAARRIYDDLFTDDERRALLGALESADLEGEVALLRVLIRRGVADGVDLETLSRSIARLAQALRVQHVIRGQSAKNLDEALARVLEEVGNELGT